MENSNTKECVTEDNGFFLHSGVLTKKDWCNIVAGTLSLLKKEIINIQDTDIFMQSDDDSLKYVALKGHEYPRITGTIGGITPTYMGYYVKIEYGSKLNRKSGLNINSPHISITTVHDKTNGKLIGGCHVKVTENDKTLGEIYIDLDFSKISGDVILMLGNIKDDVLLGHTSLNGKNTETSSIILSSIGVKGNGNPSDRIKDTVYNYSTAIVSKLNKLFSETERNYADYFIANDPLNVMLEEMANGSDEDNAVLE